MTTMHKDSVEHYRYEPAKVSAPGETLRETLDALDMSQAQLAARMGLSTKHVNQIIQGQAVLTHETAIALERVTGVAAGLWNGLEAKYRDHLSRELELQKLAPQVGWLKQMPIAALRKLGKITADRTDEPRILQQALNFFGVASIQAWEEVWANPAASYLKSTAFQVDPGAMAAWLRLGEVEAAKINCEPFDRVRLKSLIPELRSLTVLRQNEFEQRMTELCASAGVAVVLIKEITGCRASGATRWLSPTKAVVQLSQRGKRNDKFWFAFFHELAHVLLHGKRSVFIEAEDITKGQGSGSSDDEDEANKFAADVLVPPARRSELLNLNPWNLHQLRSFADRLGVAPGIVVGQLQFELKEYRFGQSLFEKYEMAD